jgi:hypothetical protein
MGDDLLRPFCLGSGGGNGPHCGRCPAWSGQSRYSVGKAMRISLAVDLLCEPHEVFRWIAEPEKAMVWQSVVKRGEVLRETPEKVGTTFREVLEEDGRTIEMLGAITGYVEDRLISFHLESRIHAVDVSYSIEGNDGGSTLSVECVIHWKFPMNLMSIVIGGRMREGILRQTGSELMELKRLCEAERAQCS